MLCKDFFRFNNIYTKYWAYNFDTENTYKHLIVLEYWQFMQVSVVLDIPVVLMLHLCFMRVNCGYVDNNIVTVKE
jgi:hypothetical protein